jgi:hypothetical protein
VKYLTADQQLRGNASVEKYTPRDFSGQSGGCDGGWLQRGHM